MFQNCFVSVRQGLLLSQKYMILMQLSIHFKCNRQLFLETIISIKNSELKLRYLLLFRAFLPEYLSLSTFAFALRLSSNCLNFRVLWQVLEDVLLLVECKLRIKLNHAINRCLNAWQAAVFSPEAQLRWSSLRICHRLKINIIILWLNKTVKIFGRRPGSPIFQCWIFLRVGKHW